jgi:zinc/manganese transport system ATP-binding protein
VSALSFDEVSIELGGRTILAAVSFAIEHGEFIGMLGANGAGKTTLMRAALGLVPLSGGAISVLGRPATRGNGAVGYMPQARGNLAAMRLTGYDIVASAAGGAGWGLPRLDAATRREIDWALEAVGAQDLARRSLAEISGGERQRLLLSQALLGRPKLLLLDEPLISLDPRHQQTVIDMVRDIAGRLNLTVLFSAHEINPLLGALDRVLYLGNTHAALGTVDDVITGPVLSNLYGAEIEVIRLHGRIFVMSRGHDVEHDAHQHEHGDGHGDEHGHDHEH